ncbi:hypothetical protein S40293_11595 [Stachybotrys chartarum IBT 40293]|nr:hypothetical protein S40293_11595 [Stachybotrys chartarum IBT 40293]
MTSTASDVRCEIPSSWRLFLFFTTNYLAHCATIRAYPAEDLGSRFLAALLALFMPASGVVRAMDAFIRHSRFFGGEEIQRAVRAGAACMLVRTKDWMPRDGDIITGLKLDDGELSGTDAAAVEDTTKEHTDLPVDPSAGRAPQPIFYHAIITDTHIEELLPVPFFSTIIDVRLANVHGAFQIPHGYDFAYIPCDAVAKNANWSCRPEELERQALHPPELSPRRGDTAAASASISSNYDVSKALIAIGQTVSGAVTLYGARYSQLDRYGYAAYGLTVVPFLIMSLINLASQIATADYPALYMVHTPVMDEARRRGGVFDGVVGFMAMDELEAREAYVWRATSQENVLSLKRITESAAINNQLVLDTAQPQSALVQFGALGLEQQYRSLMIQNCPKPKRLGQPMKLISRDAATTLVIFVLPALVISISLLIIGVLTHFQPGQSTVAQRAWTMSWLAMGIFGGAMPDSITIACFPLFMYSINRVRRPDYSGWALLSDVSYWALVIKDIAVVISIWGIFFAPTIGGLVIVGQMIHESGLCDRQ